MLSLWGLGVWLTVVCNVFTRFGSGSVPFPNYESNPERLWTDLKLMSPECDKSIVLKVTYGISSAPLCWVSFGSPMHLSPDSPISPFQIFLKP